MQDERAQDESDVQSEVAEPGSPAENPNDIKVHLSPTARQFIEDNRRIRMMMGPIGSGSSSLCSLELVRRASEQAPDKQGIRRTRFLVLRATYPELRDTCRRTFEEWFPPWDGTAGWGYWEEEAFIFHLGLSAPRKGAKKTKGEYIWKLKDGTSVYSQIFFRSAGTLEEAKQKFKSLELTGAWINEFKFLPIEVIGYVLERIDRYPGPKIAPRTWTGIWGDTNPFDLDSEHYRAFVERARDNPEVMSFYKKPGGLFRVGDGKYVPNPDAENLHNLGKSYYSNKLQEYQLLGRSDNDILRDLCGEFAYEVDGRAVFAGDFQESRHVAKGEMKYDEHAGLVVGIDPGLTVTAGTIAQKSEFGKWRLLRELIQENTSAEDYAKLLARVLWAEYGVRPREVTLLADPAIKERSRNDLKPIMNVYKSFGFSVLPSVKGLERIDSVRSVLRRVDGLSVCPKHCKTTIKAFLGGYHYERQKVDNGFKDVPKKNHPFSDIMDAVQYAIAYYESPTARGQQSRSFPTPGETRKYGATRVPKPFDPLSGMVR